MSKYIDMRTDFGFKWIFMDPQLLCAFLNAVFEKEGKVITSVEYSPQERKPEKKEDKKIFYDIFCHVENGEDFILEMQMRDHENFQDRTIYYMSKGIVDQGLESWDYRLHPVYGIFILNFTPSFLREGDVVTQVDLVNRNTGKAFSDAFRMIFINLKALKKTSESELQTNLERWIYSIKNMGSMTEAPKMAEEKPFCLLYTKAEVAALSPEDRIRWEASWREHNDWILYQHTIEKEMKEARTAGLEKGHAEGLAKGLAEGRAEGRAEGILQTARNMKNDGLPAATISKYTGLTEEEINRL